MSILITKRGHLWDMFWIYDIFLKLYGFFKVGLTMFVKERIN
jgi:hypothetical protein